MARAAHPARWKPLADVAADWKLAHLIVGIVWLLQVAGFVIAPGVMLKIFSDVDEMSDSEVNTAKLFIRCPLAIALALVGVIHIGCWALFDDVTVGYSGIWVGLAVVFAVMGLNMVYMIVTGIAAEVELKVWPQTPFHPPRPADRAHRSPRCFGVGW